MPGYELSSLLQFVLSGISTGSIYVLIALGIVTIYNVTGVINLAQGEYAMLGAMLAVTYYEWHVPLPAAFLAAVISVTLIGMLIERLTVHPVRSASPVTLIIITVGVDIILRGIALLVWGTIPYSLPEFTGGAPLKILGAVVSRQRLWIMGTAGLVLLLLYFLLERTLLGKAVRACAINQQAAGLMGVSPSQMSLFAFSPQQDRGIRTPGGNAPHRGRAGSLPGRTDPRPARTAPGADTGQRGLSFHRRVQPRTDRPLRRRTRPPHLKPRPAPYCALRTTHYALPNRPPLLCPGCGHRATFYILRQLMFPESGGSGSDGASAPRAEVSQRARNPYQRKTIERRRQYGVVVTGDIGCYTLGALQPLFAMDTCGCMGASIGYAIGLEKAGVKNKVVAVIGDSTFYHSGITGLVDVITSGAATTVIILDNFTTAMTGGNVNPGTGATVDGRPARRVELETLCRGLGVEDVQVIDAFDAEAIERELLRTLQTPEPSVLIVRAPCVLQERATYPLVSWVEAEKCVGCWACLVTACPALIRKDGKVQIIPKLCTDCEVCNQVCPYDAILRVERDGVA